MQRKESVAFEMNVVNDETRNSFQQTSNDCMKTPATEEEYKKKMENSKSQIEYIDFSETKYNQSTRQND